MYRVFPRAVLAVSVLCACDGARILMVVPTASLSHQRALRPLAEELARRGHNVTCVTADVDLGLSDVDRGQSDPDLGGSDCGRSDRPAENRITYIDMHDESYALAKEIFDGAGVVTGGAGDAARHLSRFFSLRRRLLELHMRHEAVRRVLRGNFHLLLLEAVMRPFILYAHFLKVPVVLVSSYGAFDCTYELMGAPTRPALSHPAITRQRLGELSWWGQMGELYKQYQLERLFSAELEADERAVRRLGGAGAGVAALERRVRLLLLNTHALWDHNRPVPPAVRYVGGMHRRPPTPLPEELRAWLDSCSAVVYVSFGGNVPAGALPARRLGAGLARARACVLWRWPERPPRTPPTVRVEAWLPQAAVLRHPSVRLFVTQGGLQSTEEAILAGVPLLGIPLLADQWYNVERYRQLRIGERLDLAELTEDSLLDAVSSILSNSSYRSNIVRLRAVLRDQPDEPLARAAWWTERVLRAAGGERAFKPCAPRAAFSPRGALLAPLGALAACAVGVVLVCGISCIRTKNKKD